VRTTIDIVSGLKAQSCVAATCRVGIKRIWTKPLRGIRVGPPFQPKDPALSNLAPAFL
jgi:hypothetical protein